MSSVSIVKCPDYDILNVRNSVREALELIGGIGSIVSEGDNVLLKVNALAARPASDYVTTHPSIVDAMIGEVRKAGGIPFVGDCSGEVFRNPTRKVFAESGIQRVCDENNVETLGFEATGFTRVDIPGGKVFDHVNIADKVLEADVVVSLPKLKTHAETQYTGALKNMFGATPQGDRRKAHSLGRTGFHKALADIYSVARADLAVLDGVWGMQGLGPSQGSKKFAGVVLASTDPVALDAVAVEVIGMRASEIEYLADAGARGLGQAGMEEINILGETVESVRVVFERPASMPVGLISKVLSIAKTCPEVEADECIACGVCSRACPSKAIELGEHAIIDHDRCIECYCCFELCPEGAVKVRKNWAYRMLGAGKQLKDSVDKLF